MNTKEWLVLFSIIELILEYPVRPKGWWGKLKRVVHRKETHRGTLLRYLKTVTRDAFVVDQLGWKCFEDAMQAPRPLRNRNQLFE